jgi:hypothetical protein
MKEAEGRLHLYKYYIPLIVNAICESIKVDPNRLSEAFTDIAERHVRGEITSNPVIEKEDKITGERIDKEIHEASEVEDKILTNSEIHDDHYGRNKRQRKSESKSQMPKKKNNTLGKDQTTLDVVNARKKR